MDGNSARSHFAAELAPRDRASRGATLILAFHLILAPYGSWFPNDPRGSWSQFVAAWELFRSGGKAKSSTPRDPSIMSRTAAPSVSPRSANSNTRP
jgi:hypothetical protein